MDLEVILFFYCHLASERRLLSSGTRATRGTEAGADIRGLQ